MKREYLGNYLGIVVQNNDPLKKGRVKVFIPHLSATLYENWADLDPNTNEATDPREATCDCGTAGSSAAIQDRIPPIRCHASGQSCSPEEAEGRGPAGAAPIP